MDTAFYLEKFQLAADQVNQQLLRNTQLKVAAGTYLDAVFLKIYKKSWANPSPNPLTSPSRIFFSVWITASAIQEQKIFYNIHALKLRQLKGYSIESRKFAAAFRIAFHDFEHQWKHVSVKYGPLTLMQGWLSVNITDFDKEIQTLAKNFLEIAPLIDQTLLLFKRWLR